MADYYLRGHEVFPLPNQLLFRPDSLDPRHPPFRMVSPASSCPADWSHQHNQKKHSSLSPICQHQTKTHPSYEAFQAWLLQDFPHSHITVHPPNDLSFQCRLYSSRFCENDEPCFLAFPFRALPISTAQWPSFAGGQSFLEAVP